jgi:hypothetical protein
MDLVSILSDLRSERSQVEDAIASLTRLAYARGPRRGRPPKGLATLSASTFGPDMVAAKRGPRFVSPEARRKMSAAQKRRWAAARQVREQ